MSLSTVGPSKDFSTLQGWADFVGGASSAVEDAECYSGSDLGACVYAGWVPTSSTIYAAVGHRHNGTDAGTTGVAYTTGRIEIVTNDDGIDKDFTVHHLRMHGRIDLNAESNGVGGGFGVVYTVDSNLFVFAGAAPTPAAIIVAASGTAGVLTLNGHVRNNIVLWKTTSLSGVGVKFDDSGASFLDQFSYGASIYNNTIIRTAGTMSSGMVLDDSTPDNGAIVKNNIILGGSVTDYFATTVAMTASHNMSSDATGDDYGATGSLINQTASAVVVDTSTDPTLKSTSPARNAGTTIVGFSVDAIGTSRPRGSAWDMGAIEFLEAALGRHRLGALRFGRH